MLHNVSPKGLWRGAQCSLHTLLENRSSVNAHDSRVGIFIFLAVAHDVGGLLHSVMNYCVALWSAECWMLSLD